MQTVRFMSAPGPLNNPLKGWCTYTNAGEIYQPYSLVFFYVSWGELEPQPGKFAFAEWEARTWNTPEARGKHIVLRVYADYPTLPSGLPDYLRSQGVTETAYTDHDGGKSPDYNHPAMVAGMERLIAALGERYNSHPRIAFLQLGLLGFWGEWHTYPRDKLFASAATQQRVVDAYRMAFPDKKIMARYASGYPGKQDWLGFHDDYFPEDTGDEGPSKDWHFLHNIRKNGRQHNWKRAVIGGEMVPFAGMNALKWLSEKHFAFTLRRAEEAHFSFIGPYSPALEKPPSPSFQQRCHRLVRRMGYEYRLTELRSPRTAPHKTPLALTLTGINQGVGPFYYRWPVQMALLNDRNAVVAKTDLPDIDLRAWLPGPFTLQTTVSFPAPAGTYRLAIGIHDPWSQKPRIAFANALPQVDGWTVLAPLTLT